MALLAVAAALLIGVHLMLTRTQIGRAMRAVSENPALARVAGVDVDATIRFTWAIGGALAAASGVMLGLLVQIRPFMGFDLLLPLFAAAILGGIGSAPGAFAGALIVGLGEADNGSARRLRMAGGRRLSGADRRADRPSDRPRREAGVTFDLVGPITYASFFLVLALVNALVCLGLNLQWGQTGLFNVGVAGFVAIGAYASALLTTPPSEGRLGGFALPILVGWLAAMVASGAVSAFVGALTLRLRADYLAITTFGVAVVVQLVALNVAEADRRPLRRRVHSASLRQPRGDAGALRPCQPGAGRDRRRGRLCRRWSGLRAAHGAGCCGRSAKTNAPRWRSARIRRATACKPSRSAAL